MFNVNTVKKYLPLGTVCLLKEAKKKVMIIGFVAKGKDLGDKLFDYVGCVYPEGILTSNHNLLFNHNDIQEVYFIGFSNAEDKAFKQKLNEVVNGIGSKSVTNQTVNNNQMSNTANIVNDANVNSNNINGSNNI